MTRGDLTAWSSVLQAFAGDPDVTCDQKVFSSRPLRVHGKIFAMMVDGDLVLKLPRQVVDALVSTGQGRRFDPGHGRLMKEWVVVPVADCARWIDLAKQARTFVGAQRPR
jgi:hypothetical protein